MYWVIIIIQIGEYLFDVLLDLLNIKASHRPIPKVLEGLYDDVAYGRQQAYFRINKKVGFVSSFVTTVLSIGLFAFGAYGWMDGVVREATDSSVSSEQSVGWCRCRSIFTTRSWWNSVSVSTK